MSKKYYKVISSRHGRLFSSFLIDGGPQDFLVEYFVDKWVYPTVKKTKLFVFNDLFEAKTFAALGRGHCVYECEVKNPRKNPTIMYSFNSIAKYWRLRLQKKQTKHLYRNDNLSSDKCSSCDTVKLIRKVL